MKTEKMIQTRPIPVKLGIRDSGGPNNSNPKPKTLWMGGRVIHYD